MAGLASGYRKVSPEAIPDLIAWLGRCLEVWQEQPNSPLWRTTCLTASARLPSLIPLPVPPPPRPPPLTNLHSITPRSSNSHSLIRQPSSHPFRCLAVRQEQPNSPLWRTSVLQFTDVLDHALLLDWPSNLLPVPSSPAPSAPSASPAARPASSHQAPSAPIAGAVAAESRGSGEKGREGREQHGTAAAGPLGEAEAGSRSDSGAAPVEGTQGQTTHEQQQQQQQSVALSGATATWDPAVRQRFWKELVGLYEGVVRGMCAGEGVVRGMGNGEWQSGSVQTLPPAQVHEDEVLQERMVRLLGEKVLKYCQDAPLEVKQRLVGLLLDLAERAVGEVQLTGGARGRGSSGHSGSEHGSLSGGQGPKSEVKAAASLSGLARVGSWLGWGAAGGAGAGGQVKATGSVGRGGSDGGNGGSGSDGHVVVTRTRSSSAVAGRSGSRGSDGDLVGGSVGEWLSLPLPLTPSHAPSRPLTPATPSHALLLPLTPSHALTQPLTPSKALSRLVSCRRPSLNDPVSSSAVQVASIAMPRFLAFARRRLQRFTEDCLVRGAGSMAAARRREVRVILAGLTAISLHPAVAAPLSHLLPAMLRCTPSPPAPLLPSLTLASSSASFITSAPSSHMHPAPPAPSLAHSIAAHTAPRSKPVSAPTSAIAASAAAPTATPPDPGSTAVAAACTAGTGGREKGGEECIEGEIGARGSEGECEWRVLPDGQGGGMGWRKAHLFAIYPFACDLILASATLSHCQVHCNPLGSPCPTSPSSKYLPLIPPPPLHPTTSPSSHHLPFIPPPPLHPTTSPSSHHLPFIPPPPLHPTTSPSSHHLPLIPPTPPHPTTSPSSHHLPFIPPPPLHPTTSPSSHHLPFIPPPPPHPTTSPSSHHLPFIPPPPLHPTTPPFIPPPPPHSTTSPSSHHLPFIPPPPPHPTTSPSSDHLPFIPPPPPHPTTSLSSRALRALLHAVGAEMGLHPAQRI
ncbi:unnamed protein product [Closterium sp. Naga37s-1]|nr:unnamed protein product [Closterium sp. Naga37s-1]